MKKIISILVIGIIGFSTLSFIGLTTKGKITKIKSTPPRSGGPAAILGADKTGSPLSSSTCTQCHGGSNTNTTVSIQIKNSLNAVITEYLAGESYTIETTVTNSTFSKFGMQMVALSGSNMQAGNIGTPTSANTQVSVLSTIQYLEHLGSASNMNSFTFIAPWIAPTTTGLGTVTFYGMGMAVNGNGGTSGDQPSMPMNIQLTETIPTIISYSSLNFCDNDVNQTPTITGNQAGAFTATPVGLSINITTGVVDVSASTIGDYTITYTAGAEVVQSNFSINETYTTTDAVSICGNDTYQFGTQTLNSTNAGVNTETFLSQSGCDSTVALMLTVMPNEFTADTAICANETYQFGTQLLDASNVGVNTETFPNAMTNGCDSIVTLTLSLIQNTFTTTVTICEYDTYTFGTQTLNSSNAGLNTEIFANGMANGCDSIVNLTLNITTIDNSITAVNNSLSAIQVGATYQWLDCANGQIPVVDSISQIFTPGSSDFSYAVEITLNGCVDTSDCLTVLNIYDFEEQAVSVYPNPSSDFIQINGLQNLKSISEILILDINGQVIMKVEDIQDKIEIKHLPIGIYNLSIIHSKGIEKFRIIKQ